MKLNIFGQTVRVLKAKKLAQEQQVDGLYDPNTSVIMIDEDLVGDEFKQTLIHEFIHAVLFRTGFFQTSMPMDVHEMICENISVALTENFELKPKK